MAGESHNTQLAKLSRPRLYDALPRQRLFALLDDYRPRPVIWIAAPPGAGKTTLVASYLEARELSGIWYQVDGGDADPSTFFYYLGLAERSLSARHREKPVLPLLTPEYLQDIPGFSRRFFRELFLRLDENATLVLDNFQEAAEDAPLHQAIAAALDEVPEGIRVFLISRQEPADRYSRLAANRVLGLVDWDHLKLTQDEARGMLQATRVELNDKASEGLWERCGGWAAGLMLLVERLRRGGTIETVMELESLQQVFAYFAGQLFDRTDSEDRMTLLRLSYLPSVSETMADKLSCNAQGRLILERLYRRHLFTDRRRGEETTYQFHALFRAFLQHRAETDLNPGQRADARRRAARQLESSGQAEAAMPLYIDAGDIGAAQALILDKAATLIGQGRWKVVVEWIEALPEGLVANNPWLLHWLGTAQIGVHPQRAREVLERAYSGALDKGDVMCQVQIAAGMVEAIFLEYTIFTTLDRWIPVLEQSMLDGFAFSTLESELRAQSAMLVACTYRMPDHSRMDRCVARVRELLRSDADINLRVSAATHLTLYGSFTGHLEECRRAAVILAPLLADPSVTVFRKVFAWAVITWYACNASDYVLGDQAVATNEAIARDEGIHIAERFACILGYFLDMDRGDVQSGKRRMERFEEIMIAAQPYEAASLVNMKSWCGVYTGDCALTLRHGPRAFELYNEAGSIPHILVGLNGLIWGCVEGGEEVAARHWIREHRSWSSRRNMEWARWAPDAAEAMLALRRGDTPSLEERLQRIFATERHRMDQYGHMLAWCRNWASVLSAEALQRGLVPDRVRRFIADFQLAPPSRHMGNWPWPVRIRSLGRFSVEVNGEELTFSGKVPKRLLALLKVIIAFGGKDVPEEKITDALWPDEDGDAAHQSFTTALHRLRKLLGNNEFIVQKEGRASLDAGSCWVDALAFDDLSAQAESARAGGAESFEDIAMRAASLYAGDFQPSEIGAAWVLPMRARLRDHFIYLVGSLGARLEDAQRWEDALVLYRRGVDADILTETFYQGMMRCHHHGGRTAEALSVYRRMREVLHDSFGLQPSRASEELYRALSSK